MPDFDTPEAAIAWLNEPVGFSGPAKAYAREELGMADDEPNEATGVETLTRYSLIAEAFDAGMDVGDYFEGWNEGNKAASANPSVVSTAAELNALPVGSVVAYHDSGDILERFEDEWYTTASSIPFYTGTVFEAPATILWVGGTE